MTNSAECRIIHVQETRTHSMHIAISHDLNFKAPDVQHINLRSVLHPNLKNILVKVRVNI